MIFYGEVALQIPGPDEAAWIEANIPIRDCFGFFRPKSLGDLSLNPCAHFAWFLSRPMKVNALYMPWGASRFGYAFVIADAKMHAAITAQNGDGQALFLKFDDNLGSAISTPMFMLPPVPLSKINVVPQLPLFLLPLVDERFYFWERAFKVNVAEGVTTWTDLYDSIAAGLGIALGIDPIPSAYLMPGSGLMKQYQHLPPLLDWVAASVGQRIVRRLDGSFAAINAMTGQSLMIAQANQYRKYSGGSLPLGLIDA